MHAEPGRSGAVELRGITWDHPRGLAPMLATAEAFAHAHPEVRITWEARSLQAFGDQPIQELADRYDLLVIDHPFAGFAARSGCLVPLDEHLPVAFLEEQARQSVGRSHHSYYYDGHQWALAIDAAAQVSAYRPDLLDAAGCAIPRTWDEVLALAKGNQRSWRVAIPLTPVNVICSFLSLCANHGEPPGGEQMSLVSRAVGRRALEILRALVAYAHPASLTLDPPGTLNLMASGDGVAYCPLLFGYSNYSRPGYAAHLCRFTAIPSPAAGDAPSGAILGGTGLAISASCASVEWAGRYAAWVAGADCQRTLYVQSGGQPGNRVAWSDPSVNAATANFFLDTLSTLDLSYLRPRYDGFIGFQDRASVVLHTYLRDGGDVEATLQRLDALYLESRRA